LLFLFHGFDPALLSPRPKGIPRGERMSGHLKVKMNAVETPYGDFTTEVIFNEEGDSNRSKAPVTCHKDFDKLNWYLDVLLEGDYSQAEKAADYAHEKGLLIYSHICSPIEPFLTKGYYNLLGSTFLKPFPCRPSGMLSV
jgi:hypothetical protein